MSSAVACLGCAEPAHSGWLCLLRTCMREGVACVTASGGVLKIGGCSVSPNAPCLLL